MVLLIILLFFSAFFSGAEIAFMSISHLKVRHLIEQNKRNARLLDKLKSNPDKLLITVLIGNNLANIGAASFATTVTVEFLQSVGINNALGYGAGIATGLMTVIILIFGEIYPKSFCVHHSVSVALTLAPAIKFFQFFFSPAIWVLLFINRKTTGDSYWKKYPLMTEDELITMVKLGEEEGAIKQEEKELINNVFELDNTEVAEVMTPRLDMFTLDGSMTIQETLEIFKKFDNIVYSRIPVYEENVDKIIGVVLRKDILFAGLQNQQQKKIKSIMMPALFIPENTMIDALLLRFKKQKNHLALVVDEHGGIAGLVTFEDVLEELVGEIYDETDKLEQPVVKINEITYKVSAKLNIGEINEMLELQLEENEAYDTLSGLMLFRLGHIPHKGESLKIDELLITVNKIKERRITEVIIKKEQSKRPSEES